MVGLANLNTPTQIVVSGEEAGVIRLMELANEAGAAQVDPAAGVGRLPQRADEAGPVGARPRPWKGSNGRPGGALVANTPGRP